MRKKVLKRLNTKKGFTMVELLGAIVILGILTTLSVTAIQGLMKKAHENYYKSQESSMVAAARNYAEKNKQYLPKVNGQTTYISLESLSDKKYLDKVMDDNKKTCDLKNSYVQIFYYDNDYYYTPYLKCDNYSSEELIDDEQFNISIDLQGGVTDAKAKISIKEETNGIASYNYRIYADSKLVFSSEQFDMHKDTRVSKTIKLDEYTPANIKVTVTGTSGKGLSRTESKAHNYGDSDGSGKPNCGTNINGASTTWTNGTRLISINCVDGANGIGCAKDRFTKQFTGSAKTGNIKIQDKNGNSRNCEVNVYIDKDYPEITVKAYKRGSDGKKANNTVIKEITANNSHPNQTLTVSTSWLNKTNYPDGVIFEATYEDLSGVKQIDWEWNTAGLAANNANVNTLNGGHSTSAGDLTGEKKHVFSVSLSADGYRVGKISMTDQVGYVTTVTVKVPLDKAPPTCSSSGESTTWQKDNRTVNTTFNDPLSGLKTSSPGGVTYNSTVKVKTYQMEDNAGNKSDCNVNVYVDKTAPTGLKTNYYKWSNNSTQPTSTTGLNSYTSGWIDRKVYGTSSGATDSHSGGVYYQYKTTGATGTNNDKTGSSYNVTQEGTSTLGFRACDRVGNCTDYSTKTITIEYNAITKPEITGGSNDWTNGSRKIKISKDSTAGAGIKKYEYCYANSNSTSGCSWQQVGSNASSKEKAFSTEGDKYVFFRAISNSGATSDASNSQRVRIDKTKPKCGSKHHQNSSWKKGDVTPDVDCDPNGGSPCKHNNYSKKFTDTGKTGKIQIEDSAGNKEDCTVNIYIDNTPPEITVNDQPYANSCSSAAGVTAKYTAKDPHSGLQRVGDYWGFDDTIHSEYTISRGVSEGANSFTHTHNWSANCKKRGSASPGDYCYKIKISAKDVVGNEATHISRGCSKIGW